MEIVTAVMTLGNLRAMVRTAHLAKSLLHDELAQVFSNLADLELVAAKQSVSDAKLSQTPQRETTLAIGHLQSAKQLYVAGAKKERSRWFATGEKAAKLSRGAYICDAMIASAYARLVDHKLKLHYGELFRASFEEYFHDALKSRILEDGLFALLEEEVKAYQLLRSLGVKTWEPDKYVPRVTEVLGQLGQIRRLDETEILSLRMLQQVHVTVLSELDRGCTIELGPDATYRELITNSTYTFLGDQIHDKGIVFDDIRPRIAEILRVMDAKGSYLKPDSDQLTSG